MPINIDRTKTPSAGTLSPFNYPHFKRFSCENGLKVLLVEHTSLPLVNFELCFKTSAMDEPEGFEGLSNLTTELLAEGTSSRSSEKIANELEYFGIEFSAHVDWDSIHISLSTLSKYLDSAFELYSDLIQNPIFPVSEVERVKAESIIDRQRVVDSIEKVASEKFAELLYGKFRYGTPLGGTIDSLKRIKRKNINDFFNKHFHLEDGVLLVTGDISEQQVRTLIARYFTKKSEKSVSEIPTLTYNKAMTKNAIIIHKEKAQQTQVYVGHIGMDRTNPDHYTTLLLNQIIGGYFLSRLNMNLRQDKGYTYGIHSHFGFRKITGPFLVSAAVQTEHTSAAINEIIAELRRITEEAVSDEELSNAKGYFTGVFPVAFETAEQILSGLATIETFGLPDDYFRSFRNKIEKISITDLMEAAKKYIHPDNLFIIAAGDRLQIEKPMSKNFDIKVYDLYGELLNES